MAGRSENEVRIGAYRVEREPIATGGSGTVHRAIDTRRDNALVAIKFLAPLDKEDPTSLKRFLKELAFMRECRHENLVTMVDYCESDAERPYIVMEYLEGGDLREKIRSQPDGLPLAEGLAILRDMALGLSYAHSRDIVHRDLKPANVLLTGTGVAKIADFGFARRTKPGGTVTEADKTLGTPSYMAPEQFQRSKVDHRADIYAFGLIAYEIAAGRHPFEVEGDNFLQWAHVQRGWPMPAIRERKPALPSWFETLIFMCAEKETSERAQSMDAVLNLLERGMRKVGFLQGNTKEPLLARLMLRLLGED